MPGSDRSAGGDEDAAGRASSLDEEDVGLSYTQTLLVPNKIDLPDATERLELLHELCPVDFPEYVISAKVGTGLDELRAAIYRALDVIRVYTKLPPAKEPDRERPFTLRRGSTLADMAGLVHKDFAEQLKFARVWGSRCTTAPSSRATTCCTTRTWWNCTCEQGKRDPPLPGRGWGRVAGNFNQGAAIAQSPQQHTTFTLPSPCKGEGCSGAHAAGVAAKLRIPWPLNPDSRILIPSPQ